MMSWLWRKWSTGLFLFTILSLSPSVEAANQLIIRRGYFNKSYAQDFFSYTDNNICSNVSYVYKWCKAKNSYELPNSPVSCRCSCQCFYNYETFLPVKKKCVKTSGLFDSGVNKFKVQVDFKTAGKTSLFDQNNCDNCVIAMTYLENGQWKNLSSSLQLSINNKCELSWNSSHGELEGKILKIQFTHCTGNIPQFAFLKSKGQYVIDLPTSPPPTEASATISSSMDWTNTPTFTSSSSSNHVTPTPTLKTSTVQQVSSYVSNSGGTVSPSTNSESILINPTVTPTSTTSAAISPTVTPTSTAIPTTYASQPPKEDRHKTDEADSPTGAIAGAVIACIMVIIVVIFFIIWKRRRKASRPRKSTKVATDSTGNPMYLHNQGETIAIPRRKVDGSNVMGNEEYDYASIGGPSDHQKPSIPLYESLVKDNIRDSVYAPLSKEGLDSTPVKYSYDHLQHPQYNPPHSKSDPLYNTLQPPNNDEYLEPETRISDNQPEPVYNVLEGPDANSAPQDNDPVYNVLEGPDANSAPQDNDPVYNVLEDPNASQYPQDNDPVYNILEDPDDDYDNAQIDNDENLPAPGQDNVAYSSTIDLRKAQSPSSPDYDVLEGPEGALQDSTYQPLGVRVQDDMYQPLDRTSQPIYHSLEPNDSMA